MSPKQLLAVGFLLAVVFNIPSAAESPSGCNESPLNGTSWITIDPTGNSNFVGDTVTITGLTNLEEGREVLVQVYGSSYCGVKDYCRCPSQGGTSGTVTVVKGDCGLNRTLVMVNTSSFSMGEFLVTERAVSQIANNSALLFLLAPASYNATIVYDECVAARSQPRAIPTITSQISAILPNASPNNRTASVFLTATSTAGSNTTWHPVVIPRINGTPLTTQETPPATPAPRAGMDAIPVLGVLAVWGVIGLFRKNRI